MSRESKVNNLFNKRQHIKFKEDDFQLPPADAFYTEQEWMVT